MLKICAHILTRSHSKIALMVMSSVLEGFRPLAWYAHASSKRTLTKHWWRWICWGKTKKEMQGAVKKIIASFNWIPGALRCSNWNRITLSLCFFPLLKQWILGYDYVRVCVVKLDLYSSTSCLDNECFFFHPQFTCACCLLITSRIHRRATSQTAFWHPLPLCCSCLFLPSPLRFALDPLPSQFRPN